METTEQIRIAVIAGEDQNQLAEVVPADLLTENAFCIGALMDEDLIGVLVAEPVTENEYDISYLFVEEDYRMRGIAGGMLSLLTMMLQLYGGGTLLLRFLSEGESEEAPRRRRRRHADLGDAAEGTPAVPPAGELPAGEEQSLRLFAASSGFQRRRDSGVFEIPFAELRESLQGLMKEKSAPMNIKSLKLVTQQQWDGLLKELIKRQEEIAGQESMQVYITPEERLFYDREISQVSLGESGEIDGVLLAHGNPNELQVDYLAVLNPRKPNMAYQMFFRAADAADRVLSVEATVRFHAYNPAAEQLAKRAVGRKLQSTGHAAYYQKRV